MSDQDALSTRIGAIKEKLGSLTSISKKRCMYKVHNHLRNVNKKAYKPVLLAVGPYNHHGKVGQGFMEEHKLRYLQQMLERTKEPVETYMNAMMKLEGQARECYVECISQSPHEFAEMMLLDGCFIIELFRKYWETRDQEYDPIFQTAWMLHNIARDLLLFENQLPFFVLVKLFDMSKSNGSRNLEEHIVQIIPTQLKDLVLGFFSDTLPFNWNVDTSSYNSAERITYLQGLRPVSMVCERLELGSRFKNAEFEHLLGLIHATICISILDTKIDYANECQEVEVTSKKAEIFKHQFDLIHKAIIPLLAKIKNTRKTEHTMNEDWSIHNATELEEAGVKFQKAEKSNFFAIKFNNGLMEISLLRIQDDTETFLRNLIAYEQYSDQENGVYCVYNYVCFMDHLINSPKDVELLRRKGIISNCLGDDEIISTMVNKLGHYVSFSANIYDRTSKNLNMHCNRRWNMWMAKLRRIYFNSPWALLSFLAAVLLLALAIAQTIFSIIP